MLGFIAWRTGGILCTIVVHFINNALSLTMAWNAANGVAIPSAISWAVTDRMVHGPYESTWITMSIVLTIALMLVLVRRSEATRKFLQAEVA